MPLCGHRPYWEGETERLQAECAQLRRAYPDGTVSGSKGGLATQVKRRFATWQDAQTAQDRS